MNKHELKSLLENIYRTLTQEGIIPPPSLGTGSKQWPTQSPDVAPPPPKPKPKPRLSEPEPYVRPVFPVTGRDWTVPYGPDDPNNPFGHTFQGRIDAIRHGRTYIPAPWYLQGTMAEAMNKQELKSLLENIYTTLTEDEGGDFVGPPDPTYPDFSPEDLERLTRELLPNGNTIRPFTPEELDPFHPPAWWELGVKAWQWWLSVSTRPPDPMELNYHLIPPYYYYDAQGNIVQQPWSLPQDHPGYSEWHQHDFGPPSPENNNNNQ